MRHDLDEIVESVLNDGVVVIEGVMMPSRARHFVSEFEKILDQRDKAGQNVGNDSSQVLRNYFVECPEAMEFFDNDLVDEVMKRLIDDDYVMTSSAVRNKQIRPNVISSEGTGGIGWHTDTRCIRGRRIEPSLSYYCIYLLNDCTTENGATEYVPGSHAWLERPERDADFNFETLAAPAGTVVFFDSAFVRRAGEPSERPRWSVFSHFGPWFLKPYCQYDSLISEDDAARLSERARQLFHYDSKPPGSGDDHNLATLRRVRERLAQAI